MDELHKYYPVLAELECIQTITRIHVAEKEIIKDSNQLCPGFPLLVKGSMRISLILEGREESFLYDLYPGDYCHEVMNCLMHQEPGNIRSIALEECDLYMVPVPMFQQKLMKETAFLQDIYEDAILKLHKLFQNNQLDYQSIEERLLGYLCEQKTNIIYTTHKDIAFVLHSAREVISRKLKDYEKQGWIALKKGKIIFLNKDAIQEAYRRVKR